MLRLDYFYFVTQPSSLRDKSVGMKKEGKDEVFSFLAVLIFNRRSSVARRSALTIFQASANVPFRRMKGEEWDARLSAFDQDPL